MIRAIAATILLAAAAFLAPPAAGQTNSLPDLGNSAGTVLSNTDEYRIGRMIIRQIRESGKLVSDPAVAEYLQALGQSISLFAHEGEKNFTFFVVDDPALNAFALPGGFIGVHTGLLLATENENELAGVLAHEIAHVSQRHLARGVQANSQGALVATAATVAAILLGGATGADSEAITAAIAVAQGAQAQQQINYTRSHEYEADRVGIDLLRKADFDPTGMVSFFETMSRRGGQAGSWVPEYLRTHPLTANRIAEARDQAARLPAGKARPQLRYQLARANVQVQSYPTAAEALAATEPQANHPAEAGAADRYRYALALLRAERPAEALPLARSLLEQDETQVGFHTLLGNALLAAGKSAESLSSFERSLELFPRNVPLTMAYAWALMRLEKPARAHEVLLDLANNVDYTPEHIRLLALAASAEGDAANAHYYMSEVHVINGELHMAVDELRMALASPDINSFEEARAEARMNQIKEHLPKRRPRPAVERKSGERPRSDRN